MFVDKVKIYVKGGDGGNGIVAFRREKYVPAGGPSGGDGGNGGDVILKVDEGLKSLLDFKYNMHIKAARGEHGKGSKQHGRSGKNKEVFVPPGTVVWDDQTGEMLADMVENGQETIIARGGRGGRGNARFATAKNKAPSFSEEGFPGEERWLVLELKVLADVGLVGLPNAGKSTLLNKVTEATPKVANYHFTTINPHLGVVELEDKNFTLADIPGLVEGAHQGKGLGDKFLRHIERTRIIAHVVDMAALEGRNPVEDFLTVEKELVKYSKTLSRKPRFIVANKMDLGEVAEKNLRDFTEAIHSEMGHLEVGPGLDSLVEKVFPVSAVTGSGINEMLWGFAERLERFPKAEVKPDESAELAYDEPTEQAKHKIERYEGEEIVQYTMNTSKYGDKKSQPPQIETAGGTFYVKHDELEELVQRVDVYSEEGQKAFQKKADKLKLEELLKEKGIHEGDTVKVGNFEFIYYES